MTIGNLIGITNTPSKRSAKGVWNLFEQYYYKTNDEWYEVAVGQIEFNVPGTYTWICPQGVTSVCAICVGGGGGGGGNNQDAGAGGGGGGLGWKNNIAVTPGTGYTVVVGEGGQTTTGSGANGAQSYFLSFSTVAGNGGRGGGSGTANGGIGGTYVGDYGGDGGEGGSCSITDATDSLPEAGAGGGAGGYLGPGGKATNRGGGTVGRSGVGGAAGSGSTSDFGPPLHGGGTGVEGIGVNGYPAGATYAGSPCRGSGRGLRTGFSTLQPIEYLMTNRNGGFPGGGGAGSDDSQSGNGANGIVRVIWGPNRSFPSSNTGNL